MNLLKLTLLLIVFAGCSSVPKGEYSRSHINRPYALPDDVASVKFGATALKLETDNATETTSDEDVATSPVLAFEQGISNSLSWVYPLGIKYGILNKGNHTLGLSAY